MTDQGLGYSLVPRTLTRLAKTKGYAQGLGMKDTPLLYLFMECSVQPLGSIYPSMTNLKNWKTPPHMKRSTIGGQDWLMGAYLTQEYQQPGAEWSVAQEVATFRLNTEETTE